MPAWPARLTDEIDIGRLVNDTSDKLHSLAKMLGVRGTCPVLADQQVLSGCLSSC